VRSLWHPTFGRGISITVRPVPNANAVAVEIGTASPHDATTIRVIGIEDLIADQITGATGQGGRRSEIATLVQVLVELGRAGVAGPFRPAYLRRRLARETGGEAVLEMPPAPYGLDDPSPRVTGLVAIASQVRRWRASRDLPRDAADLFDGEHRMARGLFAIQKRNEVKGKGGRAIKTAQIIPFRSYGP
jgi:hypothetical protein